MLIGLKALHDGVKATNFARVTKCGSICKIEANANLMVQLKEILETPYYYILK